MNPDLLRDSIVPDPVVVLVRVTQLQRDTLEPGQSLTVRCVPGCMYPLRYGARTDGNSPPVRAAVSLDPTTYGNERYEQSYSICMVTERIYMDHAATAPVDRRVLEAMLPFLAENFGNPSSVHARGRTARNAVEEARDRVAGLIGAEPSEVVFTSGGTEADNLAILGSPGAAQSFATTRAEHEAVLRSFDICKTHGARATWLPVGSDAGVADESFEVLKQLEEGSLVSVMMVNNETGVINDIARLAEVARKRGCVFHTDAVQAGELFEIDVNALGVDLLALSSHKVHGPKGAGMLYVRGGTELQPTHVGGSQERDRRGGTENVAAIVGFARALEIATAERHERRSQIATLRDKLAAGLDTVAGEHIRFVTHLETGAPHILSVVVREVDEEPVDGEMLLLNLDLAGLEVSAGSACTSGSLKPSHVLSAAGWPNGEAAAAVRFSLGKDNTGSDVDRAIDIFGSVVNRMVRQRA